jgi:regulator of nucleoside diphosphate kinase
MTQAFQKPAIAITHADLARLSLLAEAIGRRNRELADQLSAELVRAEIVDETDEREDFVRMGTTLEYRTDAGDQRTVTLVFPQEENISSGRISVLTPVGIALIGLGVGDSMEWRRLDGSVQRLTVQRIVQPRPAAAVTEACAALAS